jgi:hypothetical protein
MKSEIQELIEAAEGVLKDKDRSLAPFVRLRNAAAAARSSEGAWIDPRVVRPERGRWLVYFPAESTSVMDALFDGKDFWVDGVKRTKAVIAYQRLPYPPLLVETHKEQK